MAEDRVDVLALHQALDAARASRALSWRELARELGLSPSTLSRLANMKSPDVHAFMTMTQWLRVPAETFVIKDGAEEPQDQPELLVQMAPLLRAQRDLQPQDVEYLQELIGSAMRRFRASRAQEAE